MELYDGDDAVGGADLIFELLVLLVVVLELDPDSYVVAPPVYPPSILVFDPLTFVCVSAGYAGSTNNANIVISIINIPVK
jgi:hypothetical protein